MNHEAFVEKVLSFAHENHLWERGSAILAAVSGGPDSLSLLLFLKEVEEREGIRLGCCCVNHHLREAAEAETSYVEGVPPFPYSLLPKGRGCSGGKKRGKGFCGNPGPCSPL